MYNQKREKPYRYGRALALFCRLHKRDMEAGGSLEKACQHPLRYLQMKRRWDWLIDSMKKDSLRPEHAAVAYFDRQSRLPHPPQKADD